MENIEMPKIWKPEELAEYLKVSEDTVLEEIRLGNLDGFRIGAEWRCSDTDVLTYIGRRRAETQPMGSEVVGSAQDVADGGFVEVEPFDFAWPGKAGEQVIEHFGKVFETTRKVSGQRVTFRIGMGERKAAGHMRARFVVWLDKRALVEFAGGNDYENDGLLASVIKLPEGKQVSSHRKVPVDYAGFRVERYNSIVAGPYASKGLAVVVHRGDLESMIRHAMIRAQWKELI